MRHSLVKCITNLATGLIKEAAENKKDEVMLRKIHCMDLVAREAWYHNHCRRNYTTQ